MVLSWEEEEDIGREVVSHEVVLEVGLAVADLAAAVVDFSALG